MLVRIASSQLLQGDVACVAALDWPYYVILVYIASLAASSGRVAANVHVTCATWGNSGESACAQAYGPQLEAGGCLSDFVQLRHRLLHFLSKLLFAALLMQIGSLPRVAKVGHQGHVT